MTKFKKYSDDIKYKTSSTLKPSVIKDLNKRYNNDVFLNLSDEINLNILNYHFELIGDIRVYENRSKQVRNEFNEIIFSNIIYRGADYLQDLFDEDDDLSLYDFIVPRLEKNRARVEEILILMRSYRILTVALLEVDILSVCLLIFQKR